MKSYFRRESGNCRICWSADAAADVGTSKKTNKASNNVAGTLCFGYGADGKKIITNNGGYDGIMIPGAIKTGGGLLPHSQCGTKAGLATGAAAANSDKTICCKLIKALFIYGKKNHCCRQILEIVIEANY